MFLDRLRSLARRLRGRPTAPPPSAGVGAGFTRAQAPALQAFATASDAAFSRLSAIAAELPPAAAATVGAALESGARGVRKAVRKGVEAGADSGQLGHATAPLGAALRDAADLLDTAGAAAEVQGAPTDGRPSLSLFRDAAGRFGGALARLPAQPDLQVGLLTALERWEGMVVSGLERAVRGESGPDEA